MICVYVVGYIGMLLHVLTSIKPRSSDADIIRVFVAIGFSLLWPILVAFRVFDLLFGEDK